MNSKHPEFETENRLLKRFVAEVDDQIEVLDTQAQEWRTMDREDRQWYAQNDPVVFDRREPSKQRTDQLWLLKTLRNEPYFARVDVCIDNAAKVMSLYIGKAGHSAKSLEVVDWRAPIAALRTRGAVAHTSYTSPDGVRRAEIFLNRQLSISQGALNSINDTFDRRRAAQPVTTNRGEMTSQPEAQIVGPDLFLKQALEGRVGAAMREVVESLQAEQDHLIRLPHDQVLVIQGAAGTGKTVVALHRIAYLLYPELGLDLRPSQIYVIGPNRLFLDYISGVLPELNIPAPQLMTFSDWARATFRNTSLRQTDFSSTDNLVTVHSNFLKGQLKMIGLLKGWVELLRDQLFQQVTAIDVELEDTDETIGFALHIPATVIQDELRKMWDYPLERQLEVVTKRLKAYAEKEYDKAWMSGLRERAQALQRSREKLAQQRFAWINHTLRGNEPAQRNRRLAFDRLLSKVHLPDVNLGVESMYSRLFTASKALHQAARVANSLGYETYSDDELSKLTLERIEYADMAPLLTLELFIRFGVSGPYPSAMKYTVIDEAQNLSLLEHWLLAQHSQTGRMTLVGDLAQSIQSPKPFDTWQHLESAIGSFHFEQLSRSYRSTAQITRLANAVLQLVLPEFSPPIPIDRNASIPQIFVTQSMDSALKQTLSYVKALLSRSFERIAVICKTQEECEWVFRQLRSLLGTQVSTVSGAATSQLQTPVCITSVSFAKGLEFQGVLVFNASSQSYLDMHDGHLLYLAVTRALHELMFVSIGEMSPLLEQAVSSGLLEII